MTTLTTTGSVDTLLTYDLSKFGDASHTLVTDFNDTFNTIDLYDNSDPTAFEFVTHASTSVTGYDTHASGWLAVTGHNLAFSFSAPATGYYSTVDFISGPDPLGGTFTGDGASHFHLIGKINWTYDATTDSGPHINGGGLTTLDYFNATDGHLIVVGTGILPDEDHPGELLGKALHETLTTSDGAMITINSTAGIDLSTHVGTINSMVFDDGLHDGVTLTGTLSAHDFFEGGYSSLSDFMSSSTVLNGPDVMTVTDNSQAWHGFVGADKITGGAQGDDLFGDSENDTLTGLGGNDTLDGGTGTDVMIGSLGDDTYFVDSTLDKITELAGGGTDTIFSSVSYKMAANTDILILTGSAVTGTGTTGANEQIGGTDGNNTLDGGGGGDSLYGGKGDDTYILRSSSDFLDEVASEGNDTVIIAYNNADLVTPVMLTLGTGILADVENLKVTGTGLYDLTGDSGNNTLTGNASVNHLVGGGGNDVLDGGAGADAMTGGSGNDTFFVDNAGDSLISNGGSDTVMLNMSSGTFTMGANIQTVIMGGTGALHVNITNTASGAHVVGNSGANVIDGSTGGDAIYTMEGGAGADTFMVENGSDVIVESTLATGGIDLIISTDNFNMETHAAGAEKLTLTSNFGSTGIGNDLNNVITGNGFDNTLDGGHGVDTLLGGLGNDTYIVDVVLSGTTAKLEDIVTDTSGHDTLDLRTSGTINVAAPVTFTLATTLEDFDISGTGSNHFNITGNAADNVLIGNDWDNTLDGGIGGDHMLGGDGNDTYIVDVAGDAVDETGTVNSTSDTVIVKYATLVPDTLDVSSYANIENLKVTGTGAWNLNGDTGNNALTGNASVNVLTGNGGNDTLDGGLGADVMTGGGGNDTFLVDNLGDSIAGGGGTDTIFASISYALTGHMDVNNLTLTGTALGGTGNSLNNVLTGNASANTLAGADGNDTLFGGVGADKLFGNDGNDTLDGGVGIDTLTGGAGSDLFVFHLAQAALSTNADIIADFHTTIGDNDALDISDILSGGISGSLSNYVHLTQSGANTVVSVDVDGLTNGAHFVNIATLTGVNAASHWTSVDDMVVDGNLIIPV